MKFSKCYRNNLISAENMIISAQIDTCIFNCILQFGEQKERRVAEMINFRNVLEMRLLVGIRCKVTAEM